ncbi:MAG: hypothetical protein IIY49_06930 [Eubacterium sp.]|nr:hypothetical protein [Eubacterium sp.]
MKSFELKPTFENLKDTLLNDSIGRFEDVCAFAKILLSMEGSLSLGIDGKWGTGKTFYVKQTKMILDSLNPDSPLYSKDGMDKIRIKVSDFSQQDFQNNSQIITSYYDAWQHDDEEDPILSLLYQIMKDNYNNAKISNKRDWSSILASVAEALSGRNVSDLINNLKGKDLFEAQKEKEELDTIIDKFFKALLQNNGNRLIVFIDELDRCRPTYAVKLLERIKHYFALDSITFVFSVNFRELENTVRNFYGEHFDACRYMDRFFDIRLELVPVDMSKYVLSLGLNWNANMREVVCKEVINQMNFGMRETFRFLQMSKMATYKYTDGGEYENQKRWSYDDGTSNLIAFFVIVPIAIGLRMANTFEYDEFITGKNGEWLNRILTTKDCKWVTNLLLGDNESYTQIDGKTLVSEREKIREVYNAILINQNERAGERMIRIGKAVFVKELKESVFKAIGFVSPYTDYMNENEK